MQTTPMPLQVQVRVVIVARKLRQQHSRRLALPEWLHHQVQVEVAVAAEEALRVLLPLVLSLWWVEGGRSMSASVPNISNESVSNVSGIGGRSRLARALQL